MEGRVQVICREIVNPSSQIHLKKFKLSHLDQLIPPVHVPIIFFYQADESKGLITSNQVQISQQMKQSLSNTLTSFYPLAGRAEVDNLTVDCNDTGVEFIVARVRAPIMDVIKGPNMADLKQFIPMDPTSAVGHSEMTLLFVQITLFECGGISVGVCFSHMIADCQSIMAFLNAWAASCRGEPEIPQLVSFDLANYFPAPEFLVPNLWEPAMSNEKFTTKRFVFSREVLAHLKQDGVYSSRSMVKDPTRVELISAFIWKNFLEVSKIRNPSPTKAHAALHLVNLRGRKSPPHLLENVFGNCVMLSLAYASNGVEEFHDLVGELRRSIRRIDDDYITESQTGNSYVDDLYRFSSLFVEGEVEWCNFSSWCRFPVYEVDYGFGRPVWLCTAAFPTKNAVVLMSSKCGENVEAWVNMEKDVLEMIENQLNLVQAVN